MKNYLKIVEALGEVLTKKDIEIDLLKYENDNLKKEVKKFKSECENIHKKERG